MLRHSAPRKFVFLLVLSGYCCVPCSYIFFFLLPVALPPSLPFSQFPHLPFTPSHSQTLPGLSDVGGSASSRIQFGSTFRLLTNCLFAYCVLLPVTATVTSYSLTKYFPVSLSPNVKSFKYFQSIIFNF